MPHTHARANNTHTHRYTQANVVVDEVPPGPEKICHV